MARPATFDMAQPVTRTGIGSNWGWWVALGVALLVVGGIALMNLLTATAVSVFFVGVMMIVGGIAEIVFAFSTARGQMGRFLLWLLLGVLYLVAGVFTLRNPALATVLLTLLIAASLIAVGVLRIAGAVGLRPAHGWGWLLASGILTLLVGVVIGLGWPTNSLWILGLFLGIDLVFSGASYAAFGLMLRRTA